MTASYLGEVDQDDPEYETDTGEQDDVALVVEVGDDDGQSPMTGRDD